MGCVIPNEYQEVEYIENTGTQYLLTDLIFRKDLEDPKIEWKHMQIAEPNGDNMLFGYTALNGAVYFEYYANRYIYSGIGGIRYAGIPYLSSIGLNKIAICSINKEKLVLNGIEFNPNQSYTNLTTVNPMSIFAWTRTNGTSSEFINKGARIYYLRFYNGDKLLGNFIPCYRKSDNEIGMYDTVSKQFFTNQGTGTFLKGNDVYHSNVFDLLKTKKKIIMNQPHIETLTGDTISFTTDMKAPLKECKVYFEPVQEGSGDPSPENVRNITGWDKVEVKNGDNVYSIDWTNDVGTVYGGYVDLVKGEVVATHHSFTLDGVNYFVSSGGETYTGTDGTLLAAAYDYIGNNSFKDLPMGVINSIPNSISNKYLVTSNNKIIGIQTANAGPPYYRLVVGASELDDISNRTAIINSLKIWLQNNSIQICYKLAEPIHYSLTPQQILSLKGINNFSCGIKNDLSVRYWNHKKSDSNNIAYEAKNLTFNGTNYIDTGVYLFSEKNINRDFEVVIEDLYGSTTTNETIICAKHNGNSTGFLIRLTPSKNIDFNGTIYMNRNNHNYITIKRINGNISISGEIIVNPNLNFTNAVHQHPLVLGCALEDDGTPYRYATGTIGHITVKWL